MGAEDGVGEARSEAPTEVTVAEAARPQARSSVKEAIAKSALDPATIPNVPWASPAWRADVAWREAALEACYRGRSDKALRAALGQALDPRNCPREMTEGAQPENIGVVRLVHAKVAISLMSQTARAADRETARRYQTVALRIEQAGGDVALGHALCKTHLVAHCLLMSREALLNEFAALMHQPPYGCDAIAAFEQGSLQNWSDIRGFRMLAAYKALKAEDQTQVLIDMLNPAQFIKAPQENTAEAVAEGVAEGAHGSKQEGNDAAPDVALKLYGWVGMVTCLAPPIRPALLIKALSTSTPPGAWRAADLPTLRKIRCLQVGFLSTPELMTSTPELLRLLRTTLTLPTFTPGDPAWEFAAALRASAVRRIYEAMTPQQQLIEFGELLNVQDLAPDSPSRFVHARDLAPESGSRFGSAMRQRLDQIVALADIAGRTQAEALWTLTWEGESLPPEDAGLRVQAHAQVLHREALAQLRPWLPEPRRLALLGPWVTTSFTRHAGEAAADLPTPRRVQELQNEGTRLLMWPARVPGEERHTSLRERFGNIGSVVELGTDWPDLSDPAPPASSSSSSSASAQPLPLAGPGGAGPSGARPTAQSSSSSSSSSAKAAGQAKAR